MRINKILESINKAIDTIRKEKELNARGHFVAVSTIKKSMGPYKEYRITVDYVNLNSHENYMFCSNTCMERCNTGEECKLEEQCTLELLTKFFIRWNKLKDKVIVGDYGCE